MQCWTWGDICCYFITATSALFWHLQPLGVAFALLKLTFFVFVQLPLGILREFKITNFERRHPNRPYNTLFEYSAIRYVAWVLNTFRPSVMGPIFFGELPAQILYTVRRCKYGTENIGDFEHMRAEAYRAFKGYWVRSRSRANQEADLVIYFVPGNLAGMASAYFYIEYISMLLVELQVQGFANPVALVADIQFYDPGGFVAAFQQTLDGWKHLTEKHPTSIILVKGSGLGGTLLLTMQLHLARPFDALCSKYQGDLPSHHEFQDENSQFYAASEGGNSCGFAIDRNQEEKAGPYAEPNKRSIGTQSSLHSAGEMDIAVGLLDVTSLRKPDAMLLVSPFPAVWNGRFGNENDMLGPRIMTELRKRLVTPGQAFEAWTRPGSVRDDAWWAEALPDHGSVVMYGSAELLSHDIEQLIGNMKSSRKLVLEDVAEDQLHAWPILFSFIGRNVTEQISGIDQVANHIANMLVMECIA